MLGRYHLAFGISSAVAAEALAESFGYKLDAPVFYIACSAVGSIIPDIDSPNSIIGVPFYPVAKVINKIFGHRTITHDLLFAILLTIASAVTFVLTDNLAFVWVMFGYLGHLLLDGFTKDGIRWNWIKNKNTWKGSWDQFEVGKIHLLPKVLRFYSDSIVAKLFTVCLSAVLVFKAYELTGFIFLLV